MALLHPERIDDASERAPRSLRAHAQLRDTAADFFVERLSEGVATIAAAFYPRPVIVRMSDFKTNEYASLLGGKWFEPGEDNPMLGFRGASRYAHPAYAEGFALECAAMKRVREAMGLDNVKLMIPFCRRVDEAERVVARMARARARARRERPEIYVMCEIPNNVHPHRRFRPLVRRLLHRLERSDAAHAGRGPRFRAGGVRLRRARRGRDGDDPPGDREGARATAGPSASAGRRLRTIRSTPSSWCDAGIDSISLNPDSVLAAIRRILAIEATQSPAARTGRGFDRAPFDTAQDGAAVVR